MIDAEIKARYIDQLAGLKHVISVSQSRVHSVEPDLLFYDNQNVFLKAYLVSACSLLEAFIQDLAAAYVDEMRARVCAANLPRNLVAWAIEQEKTKAEFTPFVIQKTRKDISDMVSPNYWKTMTAFSKVGIDLTGSGIEGFKDLIVARVEKRNKIVHHNDDALDLSLADIAETVDRFQEYIDCLFSAVSNDPHLKVGEPTALPA